MSWTNGTVAPSVEYRNVADIVKDMAAKYMAKNKGAASEQTKAFLQSLPAGRYVIQYPFAVLDLKDSFEIVGASEIDQTVTVVKL